MINFTRAFDLAWERMHVILFRPFDAGKWFAIGLSAFLAGLIGGGNGFRGSYNNYTNHTSVTTTTGVHVPSVNLDQTRSAILHFLSTPQAPLTIVLIVLGGIFALGLIVLFLWLGARGQFMFLDNIVRNRGAISWPWSRYAREANGLFLFYLLLTLISFVVFVPIAVIGFVMALPLVRENRWPDGGELAGFIALGAVYLIVAIVFSVVLFLFREFGVPLMFRNGVTSRTAFVQTMELVKLHPGSIVLFLLLRVALAIAVAVVSVCLCCVTCCLAAIPYLGTVLLLPALVYVRCFTLDCLAQFGPQYDAWTVDVAPTAPGPTPP